MAYAVDKEKTIALVDDDQNIQTSLTLALEAEGYRVVCYGDGVEALRGLLADPPDVAVLDIKMPRMDGLELLGKLRDHSNLPVIFLTSKDGEEDEALGLRLGADDYITKPFSQRLLIARIQALLRRQSAALKNAVPDDPNIMQRGALRLDSQRHSCSWKNQPVSLTVTEFLLLQALVSRPGVVKNRDQLIDAAYGDNLHVDDRTIDSHIKRMRRKFKQLDDDFNHIETLYGIGYRYRLDGGAEGAG